jgi:hypothetical protein
MFGVSLGIMDGAGGAAGGSFESIATASPTSGYSVTLGSIASTYKHLQLRIHFMSSSASMSDVYLNFNSDGGNNYARHRLIGNGSAASASGNASDTLIGVIANNTSAPGSTIPRVAIVDIADYASTTKNKTVRSFGGFDSNSANGVVGLWSGLWMNTNAITSITVGVFQEFASNTKISLYGIRG